MSSEARFGYEWDNYSWMDENYERQFRNWTAPLSPDDWKDRRFLDAGCGMGRNSYWPLKWGASSCIAFDNDERSVKRARKTLSEFAGAEILRRNIYDIDWKSEFDIAFSIGVIHHLRDPKKAVANMVEALKPGGRLHLWVYSFEDNKWIVRFVNPVRIHITSKLPLPLVHFLAYFCSIPLFIAIRLGLLSGPYYKQIAKFNFWHVHSIVFDQLIPDVANYWKREEVGALVTGLPVERIEVYKTPEGTGWILSATKHA